jgi:hypothetical protein
VTDVFDVSSGAQIRFGEQDARNYRCGRFGDQTEFVNLALEPNFIDRKVLPK